MDVWTYGDGQDRVEQDLDLENETFVQEDEMVGYFNAALSDANAEILKLKEDYYLKSCTGVLTSGSDQLLFTGVDYTGIAFTNKPMPPDIFANKLRALIYVNGDRRYEIKRIRGLRPFLDLANTNAENTDQFLRYLITNPTSNSFKIQLTPPARETGGMVQVWYSRHLVKIPKPSIVGLATSRATVLDLPEFNEFIIWSVKCMCLPKEGDPRTQDAVAEREKARAQMIITLSEKVEDNDNLMLMDLSDYRSHT